MTFDTIRDIVVEQLGVDADMVQMDILGVEEAFGLDIPDEEAEKFETVKDLVEYVDSHK